MSPPSYDYSFHLLTCIYWFSATSKVERLKEYFDVPNVPELTAEESKAISDAGSKEHHRFLHHEMDISG